MRSESRQASPGQARAARREREIDPDAVARLRARGIDAERLRAGAIGREALEAVVGGEPAEALALVEMLASWRAPESAALLAELASRARTKVVRRAIRRSLYLLGQRGVPLPEPRSEPAPRPLVAAEAEEPEALVSHLDGRGDRLVWLARRLPLGSTLLVSAQVNEPAGLDDLTVAEITRKALRGARRDLQERHRIRLVPADWRAVDALLVEAQARGRARGSPGGDYLRARARLTTAPPAAPAPLIGDRLDPVDPTLAHESARLAEEAELASWYPNREQLAPYLAELRDLRESPIVLSPAQQQERVAALLARVAAALYPAVPWARRLEEQAYFFWASGREAAARLALAAARALAGAPAGGPPLPLFAAMVNRSMAALASEAAEREEEQARSTLIVRPSAFKPPPPGHPGRRRG